MIFFEFMTALIVALALLAIFGLGWRRYGPWESFLVFFVIIFLAAWAGGLWIGPVGPVFYGVYWLPFLLFGLLFALLLAASGPERRPRNRQETEARVRDEDVLEVTIDVFFWVLIMMLVLAVIGRYIWYLP